LQIDFKNSQQKKFYYIKRAMMMGNIFIAIAVILYLSKECLVVNNGVVTRSKHQLPEEDKASRGRSSKRD